MMYEHASVIGNVKAFDGSILFLPIQLPQQVSDALCSVKNLSVRAYRENQPRKVAAYLLLLV